MNKNMNKFWATVLAGTMMAAMLTGCSGQSATSSTGTGTNDTGAETKLDLDSIYGGISTEQTYIDINSLPQPKADEGYTIGLAMLNVNTGFFKSLADSCKAEIEAMGGKALLADCESDATKQVSQIENFIAQGVDAIIVNPADPQQAVNIALNKAYDAGIPVVSVDLPPDEGAQYLSACVTDAYQLGYLVGEELAKQMLAGNEGEVEYGIIGGTEGNYIATNRNQGARDAIAAIDTEGRLKEVSFLYAGDYSEQSGMETAENMLVANPNLKCIIGTCDAHVVGAYAAAKRQGRDQSVIMGAVDGSKAAVEIMKAGGSIKALGVNSPVVVGEVAARTIVNLLNDSANVPTSKLMAMQPELLTPENCDGFEGF
ncbi:sugar ABC transporter substrate-binding protein [Butyricicoccus sp. Marseille-Q5471]|uniref:sugar ABC transporter substrate-binding protein n=1 Tax=Butyricicoccus sp. Marseille-Q5471 TaxID=3039493 RepID=UPI0024BCF05B|nr:sugar ABC transporter substrate-binding protein [Butyricicoccus sp. Marseille-Q5471]